MDFNNLFKKTEHLFAENSTAILTAVGVTGTVTTAFLTGRASFKAAELIQKQTVELPLDAPDPTLPEKIKLVWPLYLPAAGSGVTTVTSIIFANKISSKKTAALAAAYGISERAFSEYKEKVVERLGQTKEVALRDEIAQDRVKKNPLDAQLIITGTGDVLCYDAITGRYFNSTMETIKKAENKVNYEIIHHMYASLSSFYDEIGLPPTSYSDDVGWNLDNILDVTYSSTISEDGKPCIVIDFRVAPVTGYAKVY